MTTEGIKSPAPNTQPIYPRTPFTWRTRLTTQTPGFNPSNTGGAVPPVLLGTASDSGAIMESVAVSSHYVAPAGGGSGGGGANPDGPLGLRTSGDEQWVYLYTKKFGSDDIFWIAEFMLNPALRFQFYRWGFPILPSPQGAWRLEPGESFYVGLKYAAPAPGLLISVMGGHYE